MVSFRGKLRTAMMVFGVVSCFEIGPTLASSESRELQGKADIKGKFVEYARHIGESANEEVRARRLWWVWAAYMNDFALPKRNLDKIKKIVSGDVNSAKSAPLAPLAPEVYFALSEPNRKHLVASVPGLKYMVELWARPLRQRDQFKASELKKTLDGIEERQPAIVVDVKKEVIAEFHKNEFQMSDRALDKIVGIEYDETEKTIRGSGIENVELLVGRDLEVTQTSYQEIRKLFRYLRLTADDIIYDLGSGYGRLPLYGGIVVPDAKFRGVEIVSERVRHTTAVAKKLGLGNVVFRAEDVLVSPLEDGTIFYFFNPFPSIMGQVLSRIEKIAKTRTIRIVAYGASVETVQRLPWLIVEKDLESPWGLKVFRSISPGKK